jgi:hypothetical protein
MGFRPARDYPRWFVEQEAALQLNIPYDRVRNVPIKDVERAFLASRIKEETHLKKLAKLIS